MTTHETKEQYFLSNKAYDFLKFVAQILIPAIGTLYFTLAGIWNLPKPEEVVGTLTAIDVFLGLLLSISTKSFNESEAKFDGTIEVSNNDGVKVFTLSLNSDPQHLDEKKEAIFRISS